MTEPQGSELFPTPDSVEADRQRDLTTGLLPSQLLREAVAQGREILSPQPIGDDQIQPASIDLRLGEVAYRVRASFLPGARASVRDKLDLLSMHRIDLTAGRGSRKGLRLYRAVAGICVAAETHRGGCQPEELDRPARCLRPGHHRLRHRIRPHPRGLQGAALCRDLAARLQHPGAHRLSPGAVAHPPRLARVQRYGAAPAA